MNDYQKYLIASHIVERLADRIVSGDANVFEHRAWVRGYFFKEYLNAKMRKSILVSLKEDDYLVAAGMWFCPKCFRPIERPCDMHGNAEFFEVSYYTQPPSRICQRCWDIEEAEDNQPARQPASLQ